MPDPLAAIRDGIFLVSYGGGHAAALAPVASALAARNRVPCILGLTTAKAFFERQALEAIGASDLVSLVPGYETAMETGWTLSAGRELHPSIRADEAAAYLGIGYTALVKEFGPEDARARFLQLDRQAFRPNDFFARLFERARPACVVATNSPRSERAALEAAREAGIPSLCLVDLYAAFEIDWCGSRDFASKVCVLNETVRQRFIARGADPDRIFVTGNPAFDRIGKLDRATRRAAKRVELGLAPDDRLIVWISQPEPRLHPFSGIVGDPELPRRIERHLASCFATDQRVHMVFRLHPSEHRPYDEHGPRIRYGSSDESLDDLLCAADCVVTCSSTVGLEAALIGTPVVQIMESIFSPDLPLTQMGYALEARDLGHAKGAIEAAFRVEAGEARPVQSDAGGRIAAMIEELAA